MEMSEDGHVHSPNLSFEHVDDNALSPPWRAVSTRCVAETAAPASTLWVPPPSEVDESQDEQSQSLLEQPRGSPSEVLQMYCPTVDMEDAVDPVTLDNQIIPSMTPNKVTLELSSMLCQDQPHSHIQRPPPISDSTYNRRSFSESEVSKTGDPPAKRPCHATRRVHSEPQSSAGTSTTQSLPPSSLVPASRSDTSSLISILTIRAPQPSVSSASLTPSSLVTRSLESMHLKVPPSFHLCPTRITRPLRPFERGYWHIPLHHWPLARRHRCWAFVGDSIAKGKAGWGVCAQRDAEWSYMRLYCWGRIVGELWSLLCIAAEGVQHIRGVGAVWIGGDGCVIVEAGE